MKILYVPNPFYSGHYLLISYAKAFA
jgi:hypothetical protein